MKFDLEKYEPVDERIKKFYSDHLDGKIVTELKNSDYDKKALFIASLFIGERLVATGWAYEERIEKGAYNVNTDCWLENSETSAIGRCLANYGYSGARRPSQEEMKKVERMAESKGIHGTRDVNIEIKKTELIRLIHEPEISPEALTYIQANIIDKLDEMADEQALKKLSATIASTKAVIEQKRQEKTEMILDKEKQKEKDLEKEIF